MKISLFWTAAIAELRFIRSSVGTETVKMTEIIEATVMVLALKKWLLKMMTVLSLADTALAAAMIQDWQCLNCCNSLSVSVKT